MADAAGIEAATQFGARLLVAAGVIRAAVVVDVVVAIGREVVARRAAIGALRCVVAAVGEGHVVIDDRAAVAHRHARLPALVEIVGVQGGDVGAGDVHRALPRLIAEQVLAVDAARQLAGAQQLVAGHRALRAGLVVGIHFQLAAFADEPVSGQRVEIAVAVGVLDVGIAGVPRRIEAHAESRRDPVAYIGRDIARAFRIGAQGDGAHFGRALAHVVDDAARRHHAGSEAGFTLEDLHFLHVFQGQALFAGDGQAVEAVAGGRVQGEAADGDVLVVADRRVGIAQRGIVAGQLGQRTHLATVEVIAVKHVHRGRRVLPAAAAEGIGARGIGCGFAGLHAHGGQLGRRLFGARGVHVGGCLGSAGMQRQGGAEGKGEQGGAQAAVHSVRLLTARETKRRRTDAPARNGGATAAQSSLRRCKPDQVPRDSLSLAIQAPPLQITISLQTVRICERWGQSP